MHKVPGLSVVQFSRPTSVPLFIGKPNPAVEWSQNGEGCSERFGIHSGAILSHSLLR